MNATAATASAAPLRVTRAETAAPARPFASVEIVARFDAARPDWRALEAYGGPYQTCAFCCAWAETVGEAEGWSPLIAIARDSRGAPLALLPMGVKSVGPLRLRMASFLGGRMANYQMGLFRPDALASPAELERLLRAIAAAATPPIDMFAFMQQPETWRGAPNPLIALGTQPSPSFAYATDFSTGADDWRKTHFSNSTLKKLRRKAAKLEALGEVRLERAESACDIEACLHAFLEQKRKRMQELGIGDEFERADTLALLRRLSGLDGAERVIEWRAWRAGERYAALLAGLSHRGRLSGLLLSHDRDPEVSAASPGQQLILALIPALDAEGFDGFDLGVGEARYKEECCEIVEPLFDVVLPMTGLGRAGALALRLVQAIKRHIKRSPRLFALARRVRNGFRR